MIPVSEPLLGGKELEYVTDCIKTGWISSAGKYISDFESGCQHIAGKNMASLSAMAQMPWMLRCTASGLDLAMK